MRKIIREMNRRRKRKPKGQPRFSLGELIAVSASGATISAFTVMIVNSLF